MIFQSEFILNFEVEVFKTLHVIWYFMLANELKLNERDVSFSLASKRGLKMDENINLRNNLLCNKTSLLKLSDIISKY